MQQQEKFKFPRTFHFTDSGSIGSDDKIFRDWEETLWGKPVEITWKMDGENTTLYADGSVHARSVDSKNHWSRDDLTSIWKAKGKYALPHGWRIVVENLTAVHSIEYEPLNSLYPCIAIIDDKWMVHSSLDKEACKQLDCQLLADCGIVPVSAYGNPHAQEEIYSERHPNAFVLDHSLINTHLPSLRSQLREYSTREGFVVRNALPFHVSEYSRNVVKWVRKGHVQTDKHWMYAAPKRNHLAEIGGDRCNPLSADDWLSY